MTTFQFDVNDVVKEYSEKDFERQYDQPRSDVFFEFAIAEASLGQAKVNEEKGTGGYLQLAWKVNALDSKGAKMFTKFVNLALPVSYKGHTPHESAAGILASALKAIYPEVRPYDEITEDAIDPKKKVYLLKGQPVSKEAFKAGEKAQSALAVKTTDGLLSDKRDEVLADMVGRKFFAKIQGDKTGTYFNVKPIVGVLSSNDEVCYDPSQVYSK
jgi:hypothetical protein